MRRLSPKASSGSHLEQFGQRFSVGSQDGAKLATFVPLFFASKFFSPNPHRDGRRQNL
jgi:hypothetical protein